jgi:hypothetical protein
MAFMGDLSPPPPLFFSVLLYNSLKMRHGTEGKGKAAVGALFPWAERERGREGGN